MLNIKSIELSKSSSSAIAYLFFRESLSASSSVFSLGSATSGVFRNWYPLSLLSSLPLTSSGRLSSSSSPAVVHTSDADVWEASASSSPSSHLSGTVVSSCGARSSVSQDRDVVSNVVSSFRSHGEPGGVFQSLRMASVRTRSRSSSSRSSAEAMSSNSGSRVVGPGFLAV